MRGSNWTGRLLTKPFPAVEYFGSVCVTMPPIVRPPPQRLGIVADVADERVGVRVLRAQRIGRVVGEVELAAECPGARLAEQLVLAHDPGLDRMGTARVREIDARVEGDVVA